MGSFASSLFSQPEDPAPGTPSDPDPSNPKVGSSEDPNPTTSSPSEDPEPDASATKATAEGSGQASEDPKPATAADEEEEEEEVAECGFCLFMKGGGCKDEFVEWEECIKAAENNGDDIAEKCFEITRKMRICMDAHPEYYEPILAMEKEMEKSTEDAEESEKEVDVAAAAAAAAAEDQSAGTKSEKAIVESST